MDGYLDQCIKPVENDQIKWSIFHTTPVSLGAHNIGDQLTNAASQT